MATMSGKLLWFNEGKDLGLILTEEGERLPIAGTAFARGAKPTGRCADTRVTFELCTNGGRVVENVALVETDPPRRARLRHRSIRSGA